MIDFKKVAMCLLLLGVFYPKIYAQVSYQKALKDFLQVDTSMSFNTLRSGELYMTMNREVMKDYDEMRSKKLVEEYVTTLFESHLLRFVLMPCFKEHVSIEELQELTASLGSEMGHEFMEKNNQVSLLAGFALGLQIAAAEIDEDSSLNPIEINEDCPKDYQQLFEEFYLASNMEKMVITIIEDLSADDEQLDEKSISYIKDNWKPMVLNSCFESMSLDLLKFGLKLVKSPAYQHLITATETILKNPEEVGAKLLSPYLLWLAGKGVELSLNGINPQ